MARKPIPIKERFFKYVQKTPTCWLWTGYIFPDGYGEFWGPNSHQAHRNAWEILNGPIPNEMDVLHFCDVRHCVNPSHLWLGTQADNNRDRDEKGRGKPCYGEQNGRSKVTNEIVKKARKLYLPGKTTISSIAIMFKIDRSTLSRIIKKETWKHV